MVYGISKTITTVSIAALLLGACGGGSEGTGVSSPSNGIKGVVSAPGGGLAFNRPGFLERMLAGVFGKPAAAAISGVAQVGSGVTVVLVEVDASGAQVGEIIASAETDALGAYTIEPPEGFTAGSRYVMRALGQSETIEARVSGKSVDINPVSDAASHLVISQVGELDNISTTELQEFVSVLDGLSKDIDAAGLSAQSLSAAMQAEAVVNTESGNIFHSAASSGQICGKVSNAAGQGLGNVRILARDFNDWVTRSKTVSASDGSYCLNVPKAGDADPDTGGLFSGHYILGALNRNTDAMRSASQWWSVDGNAYSQFEAERITIADSITVVRDFQLSQGASVNGRIRDGLSGANIEGVQVVVREFDSLAPVASARSKVDGSFRINLIAGKYFIEARNTTVQPFASEVYDGANGSNNRNHSLPVVLNTGQSRTINFDLATGFQLSGAITNGVGGSAVSGRRVMVNLASGGSSMRFRTNKAGQYRVWLPADTYHIFAYGQKALNQGLTGSGLVVNFESPNVSAIAATVVHNNVAVSQAKVRLYDINGVFVGMEPSNSDGTVTMYTDATGDYYIEARIDRAAEYGTIIYDGQTRLLSGNTITVAAPASTIDQGDINLPDAGVLTGKVTSDGVTPIANFRVSVRNGGVAAADQFTLTRTRGDGTFLVSLPAGTYERVKMVDASLAVVNHNANCNNITIVAGETRTLNYNNGTDTCF